MYCRVDKWFYDFCEIDNKFDEYNVYYFRWGWNVWEYRGFGEGIVIVV